MAKKTNQKVMRYSFFTTVIVVFITSLVIDIPWVYFWYVLMGLFYATQYAFQQLFDKEAEDRITLPNLILLLALLAVTAAVISLFNLNGFILKLATGASLLVDWLIFYAIFRK
ncbi:hypothetical protein PUF88_02485 [Lactobacillaceae bacterium L1_55_11]|nr:hypothetical protein [Lactobacillaceae bacterium L1_55_11]